MSKHFLRDTDFSQAEIAEIFGLASSFKQHRYGSTSNPTRTELGLDIL